MPEPLQVVITLRTYKATLLKNTLHKIFFLAIVAIACFLLAAPASAQEASDSTEVDSLTLMHSPKKATLMSAVLPGLGQIYNKKAWKVPLIYAGFATIGYFIYFNNKYYTKFKSAYKYQLLYPDSLDRFNAIYPDFANYPVQSLQDGMDTYRRWRDLNVLGFAALYFLQIIDANVDAHLFYYDISKNITMKIHPGLIQNDNLLGYAVGLKINLHF